MNTDNSYDRGYDDVGGMPTPEFSAQEERNWGMFCHLAMFAGYVIPTIGAIIGPLIVWLLKKDESEFVDYHGKQAINFQISVLIYVLLSVPLLFVGIGFVLIPIILIANLVLTIVAAVEASNGNYFKYPLTIQFVS